MVVVFLDSLIEQVVIGCTHILLSVRHIFFCPAGVNVGGNEFPVVAEKEKAAADAEGKLHAEEQDLQSFYDLKEKLLIVYEGKPSRLFTKDQAVAALKAYPSITAQNYRNVDALIANQEAAVQQAAADLAQKQKEFSESSDTLATAEKVFGGTYVQSLAAEERQRRETQYLPNGIKSANGEGI